MDVTLKPSCMEEVEQLNLLYESACTFFKEIQPNCQLTPPEICIKQGCLPPNGVFENYQILSIYVDEQLIGYCDYYMGYPDDKTVYISLIYISEGHRKRGYANQVVNILVGRFLEKGYENVRLIVSLKNWIGIKFWVKNAFHAITLAAIDSAFGDDKYGEIELERVI